MPTVTSTSAIQTQSLNYLKDSDLEQVREAVLHASIETVKQIAEIITENQREYLLATLFSPEKLALLQKR